MKEFYNKYPYFRWLTLITHSAIPLILMVLLLWSTEVSPILKDKSYWIIVFLWNMHFLLSSKYLISSKRIIYLGIFFWLVSMILAVIMSSSPIYKDSTIYIIGGIFISVFLVVLSLLLTSDKYRKK